MARGLSPYTSSTRSTDLGIRWMGHEFWLHHDTYWPCDLAQAYFLI